MTKLFTIVSIVISFVLCVQSYKIPNELDSLLNELDMFKNSGPKTVQFLKVVSPSSQIRSIKQVGGLDSLADGNLLVFHRGNRVWTYDSFLFGNKFNQDKYGPIEESTISKVDPEAMTIIDSWGNGIFYMPHGLTVDHNNKVWVTDVGLHQVMKFDLNDMSKPELKLGEALEPGKDNNHFCKPTDVAVSKSNGHIFVSDGYCNQRVVEFDEAGKFVKSFEDKKNPLVVAHSIALIEPLNLICTVSREEGRIVCFDINTSEKVKEIVNDDMLTVYAIEYDPINKVLHAATGDNHRALPLGLTFDASSVDNFGKFIQKWDAADRDLSRVHDVAISRKGERIFLAQLNGEIDELARE